METPAKQPIVRLQKLEIHSRTGSHDKSNQLATNQTASQTQLRQNLDQNPGFTPQKPSNNFRSHRDNTSSHSNDIFTPGKTSNLPTRLNSTNSSLIHTVGKRTGPKFDLKNPYASPITVDDINALGYTPSLTRSKQSLKFGKLLKGLNYCSVVNSTRDLLSQRVSAGVSRSGSNGISAHQPADFVRPETPVTRIENVFQATKLELLQMTEDVAAENKGPDMETNYFEDSPQKQMLGRGFSRLQTSTDEALGAAANASGHKRQRSVALNIARRRTVALFDRVEQKLNCDQGLALIGHIEFPKVQNKSLPCTVEILCELEHPIYVYINFNKPATKSEFVIKSHQRKVLIPQSYSHLMVAPDSIRFRIDSEFPSELLAKASFHITPIAVTKAMEALADTFGTSAPKGPNRIISEEYVRSVTNMKIRSSKSPIRIIYFSIR